mgnify:CR=1 FL=1|tara:strand:+ start:2055 stop:2399 length:345 start_codon:yes stop_codon:yes gene_type:complete
MKKAKNTVLSKLKDSIWRKAYLPSVIIFSLAIAQLFALFIFGVTYEFKEVAYDDNVGKMQNTFDFFQILIGSALSQLIIIPILFILMKRYSPDRWIHHGFKERTKEYLNQSKSN